MLPLPTTKAVPKKMVSPRHAMLENLIDIVTQHANDQLLALAGRLAGALLDASDMSDAREVHQRFKAGNLLKSNSYAFLRLASGKLERAVRLEFANLAPLQKNKPQASTLSMTLVPFEAMDTQVEFGALSRPFEILYADQLATLNVRLGFLLDRDILRGSQNPFRPDVFLLALHEAWLEFEPDADSAKLLLPLFKPELFLDLGPMLEALNLALMRKGVLPGSVETYRGRRADSHDATPKPAASNPAALAQQLRQFFSSTEVTPPAPVVTGGASVADFDLTIPHLPETAGAGWTKGAAEGFHGAVNNELAQKMSQVGAKQPLLSYLAGLQAEPGGLGNGYGNGSGGNGNGNGGGGGSGNGHAHAHGNGNGNGNGGGGGNGHAHGNGGGKGGDADGAEQTGVQAHNVIYLPGIKANAPKGSLTRADESTIDLLSAIFETVFQDQNISKEIRDLIRFLQIPVLKAALVDKDFFFQETHPARRLIDLLSRMGWEQRKGPEDPLFQAMQRSVERVGRDFNHEISVFSEAVSELEETIRVEESAAATAIAAPIASALRQEKMQQATRDAKQAVGMRVGSGEVLAVVETFLEDKWVSVMTIAYSVEEEKAGAVGNASQTMDDLIWSVKPKSTAEERRLLIGKLPPLLSGLNKWLDVIKWQDAERLRFFAELAECHASIVRAPLELSPERQVEISLDVAQQAAQRRLELQSRAAPEPEPLMDEAVLTVDSLQRGMWMAVTQTDGASRNVKLAWISPLRTLYIFSTHLRQEAFSMSGETLARHFREGRVALVQTDGLVGRALSQAMEGAAGAGVNAEQGAYA